MSTELISVADENSLGLAPEGFEGVGFWVRAGGRLIDLVAHYILWIAATFTFAILLGLYAAITHIP